MSNLCKIPEDLLKEYGQERLDLIKRTVCRGVTDDEFIMFMTVVGKTKLDPFARQISAVKRWDSKARREVMAIQITIDGFRLIAERTGKYQGQEGPYWCGDDGKWKEVWLEEKPPAATKIAVMKKGFEKPLWAVARWKSYVPTYREKSSGTVKVSPMWNKMPDLMLGKVAEMLALRRAFPMELAGIYGEEEMEQTQNEEETKEISEAVKNTKTSTAETVKDEMTDEERELFELGNFEIKFGVYLGSTIKKVPRNELTEYMKRVQESVDQDPSLETKDVKEFLKKASRYLVKTFMEN